MDGATSTYLATVFGVAPVFVIIVAALFWFVLRWQSKHEKECAEYRAETRTAIGEIKGDLQRLIGVVEGRLPPLE